MKFILAISLLLVSSISVAGEKCDELKAKEREAFNELKEAQVTCKEKPTTDLKDACNANAKVKYYKIYNNLNFNANKLPNCKLPPRIRL